MNARFFILSRQNKPEFTFGDLFKIDDSSNVVIAEENIVSMLEVKVNFDYDWNFVTALRQSFCSLVHEIYRLVQIPEKSEKPNNNIPEGQKKSSEDFKVPQLNAGKLMPSKRVFISRFYSLSPFIF